MPLLLWLVCIHPVFASPADYIYTPIVEYGEKEVDIKYGSARQKDGTYAQAASIGFGYGAKEHWFTEFYLKQESSGNQNNNLAEWENKFQLTETGEYPVDMQVSSPNWRHRLAAMRHGNSNLARCCKPNSANCS